MGAKRLTRLQRAKKEHDREELKKIIEQYKEEQAKLKKMDEEQR